MLSASENIELLKKRQKETSTVYKPEFFRLDKENERTAFNKLLTLPGITVIDHILDQIKELVKLKSPDVKFSPEALKLAIEKHIGQTNLNDYGVWLYYPWSNRLVHILDAEEFIEVRTSRNQYKITREERDLLATKKIGIVGLSVGQSVSLTLVMERICGELRLADFDLLELTNLNRIRTGLHNLGLAKVYSVAREISEIDPFINVICFPEGLHENNMHEFFTKGGNIDLLVEESDGFDIKILSRYKARELKIPVIMEASDRCMVDVERFDLEPDRNILHGIVKHLDVEKLKKLTTNDEKIPYMLDILGLSTTSPRLRASMLEMQQTISTWPQLGSSVTMGGGITADVSRRMLLNQFTDSGRYYVDIDELIGNKKGNRNEIIQPNQDSSVSSELSFDRMKEIVAEVKYKETSDVSEPDLEKIVEAGSAAPSYANKQPWKWLSVNKKLFLFKNSKPSFHDQNDKNTYISLGSAIENVLIASESCDYSVKYTLQPLTFNKDLIAVFSFTKTNNKNEKSLSPYIFERHTNRKPGLAKLIKPTLLKELIDVAHGVNGSSLSFVIDEENIKNVGHIAGAIERIRLLHPASHADYFKNEIRWNSKETIREGIDVKTLELPTPVETALEVVSDPKVAALLNRWGKGVAFEKQMQHTVEASSAIGLLSMPGDSFEDLINGGRLAEKIWLTATKNNLAFQPICLPLSFLKHLNTVNRDGGPGDIIFSELNVLKEKLSLVFSELNSKEAVFLFRLFEADKPLNRSFRKPLSEIYIKS